MIKKFRSYLDRLEFSPRLKQGFVFWYLTNIRVVLLLMVTIVGFGLLSFFQLERRLNPEINIPIVVVSTVLPGASPTEVEQLITIPLENALSRATDLEIIASTSQENVSVIQMQFLSQVAVIDARADVQRLVDGVTGLSEDAEAPQVQEVDFEAIPIWELVVSSDSPASMRSVAEEAVERIEELGSIENIAISGLEEEVIIVELLPSALDQGLQVQQLQAQLRQVSSTLPISQVGNGQLSFPLVIGQAVADIETLRQLPIMVNQELVPLSEVAQVRFASDRDQARSYFFSKKHGPQSAIILSVYKTSASDIITAQEEAAAVLEELRPSIPDEVEIIDLSNTAQDIDEQFASLQQNFAQTIFLVFMTLLLFLGIRQAFMASLAIPLAFFVSFTVMNITGQSLNFLSLFSLLLALGLLLDNAIVIIASITEYSAQKKFSAQQAGLLVWQDFVTPIITTTLTTVWAFLPLILGTGIIGEFIKPIPIVVSTTLVASAVVAMGITLPIMMLLLDFSIPKRVVLVLRGVTAVILVALIWVNVSFLPLGWAIALYSLLLLAVAFWLRQEIIRRAHIAEKTIKSARKIQVRVVKFFDTGLISLEGLRIRYQVFLRRVLPNRRLRWQLLGGVIAVALFSYLLVPFGFVPSEFFPSDDNQHIYVEIELPVGTKLSQTEQVALSVADDLRTVEEVQIGSVGVGQASLMSGGSGGSHIANLTLLLVPAADRSRTSPQMVAELTTQYQHDQRASISFMSPSGGPPAGSDVTVKITGDELGTLSNLADEIEIYLAQAEGVSNIDRSIKPGPSRLRFDPDMMRIQQLGVSVMDIGFWVRANLSELEVRSGAIFEADQDQRMIIALEQDVSTIENLSRVRIPSTSEGMLTLGQLGTFSLEPSPTQITREDGVRTLTVTADVRTGYSAPQINQELFAFLDTVEIQPGYAFDTGGANEENERSVQSIIQAMALSFVLILATMVIQLGSFRKAALVMVVIPLAITGVFIMFALTQTPLSFPALIGILALFGIVVNNSIILMDKISQNLTIGMELEDAIVDASSTRLQPIFFSSLTTIIGLLPITLSDPIWQGLGGAIISGLIFSGSMMLVVIPLLYYAIYASDRAVVPLAHATKTSSKK